MPIRRQKLLVFEDLAYGSYTAVGKVPLAGYRWAPDDEFVPVAESEPQKPAVRGPRKLAARGPWLVENDPIPGEVWGTHYSAFEKGKAPRLFEEFQALARRATPEQFLGFANKYGFLGHRFHVARRPWAFGRWGEALAFWEHHARRARALRHLAGWCKRRDVEKLASVVFWARDPVRIHVRLGAVLDRLESEAKGEPYVPLSVGVTRLVVGGRENGFEGRDRPLWFWEMGYFPIDERSGLLDPTGQPHWDFGDVAGPAWFYVCEELNESVKGHVNPKLLPFVDEELARVYFVPDCLLSTIYLQMQMTLVRGEVDHDAKQCERDGCTNFFPPARNQRYCSPTCQRWGRSQVNRQHRRTLAAAAASEKAAPTTPVTTPMPADGGG